MKKLFLLIALICLDLVGLTNAGQNMTSSPVWSALAKTMAQKSHDTSGYCVTLYNFESHLAKTLHEAALGPGGLSLAQEPSHATARVTKAMRRRPLCPAGFMARFAGKQEALAFATNEDEGGQFLKPQSLAVILIEQTLEDTEMGELFDSGTFGRTPQLTILAQVIASPICRFCNVHCS